MYFMSSLPPGPSCCTPIAFFTSKHWTLWDLSASTFMLMPPNFKITTLKISFPLCRGHLLFLSVQSLFPYFKQQHPSLFKGKVILIKFPTTQHHFPGHGSRHKTQSQPVTAPLFSYHSDWSEKPFMNFLYIGSWRVSDLLRYRFPAAVVCKPC